MQFKRIAWSSLLVLFLAACGTQTQVPEAVPTVEEGLGEISAAELEQALNTAALTTQGAWNKQKYNQFILKKKVEGKAPKNKKYAVAVLCKVPGKEHKLKPVLAAYLKGGQKAYQYVHKSFNKCVVAEFKHFGDEVKFSYENRKYHDPSDVKYEGRLKGWGKYKTSKFFHVKNGKSVFTAFNLYKKVVKVSFAKKFVDEYGKHVDIKGKAEFKLICRVKGKEVLVDTFHFNKRRNFYQNKYESGLDCYLKESFKSREYKLVEVKLHCYTYTKRWYDDKNPFESKVHSTDGMHAKSGYFTIPNKGKLHCLIVDKVEKREKKITKVSIRKDVRFKYSKDEHEAKKFLDKNHVSFKIGLFCAKNNDVKTKFAGSEDFEFEITRAGDVRGTATYMDTVKHKDLKRCYVTEIEDPKKLTGRVTFRVMVDEDRDGNPELNKRSDLRNDAYTARFDAQDKYGKLKFDVPAGSQVSIHVVDRIDLTPMEGPG